MVTIKKDFQIFTFIFFCTFSFVSALSATSAASSRFGDLSGVFDLDFDLDLRRVADSPSSSELDDEELDDDELDEEPGGAKRQRE